MRYSIAILGAALLAGTASAQVANTRALPFGLALEAAQAALAACRAQGSRVTVVVLDSYDTEQVVLRDDRPRAAPETRIARRKAHTALGGEPSSAMADLMEKNPDGFARQAYIDAEITPQAGGLPIKVGNETIAAIGVSGANASAGVRGGVNDERCAAAGIARIQDRLK
jgi:uncharacterized protein GlcG (DUF336 family)